MRSFIFLIAVVAAAGLLAFGAPILAFYFMGAQLGSAMQYGGLIAGAFITIISAAALFIKLLRPSAG